MLCTIQCVGEEMEPKGRLSYPDPLRPPSCPLFFFPLVPFPTHPANPIHPPTISISLFCRAPESRICWIKWYSFTTHLVRDKRGRQA